ncbi:MAG: ATP-dependent sacrificial sulfur transferase LarE [Promethearchaeota archaeon]
MKLNENLENKLNKIITFLKDKKVIIAFSGGVDSTLLAFLSKNNAKETLLVTEQTILYPEEEIEETKQFASKYDISHLIIERDPLIDDNFRCNPKDRCYICKTGLYETILEIKQERNYDIIIDGSNLNDLSDYRPGMKALEELEISTPYVDFGIDKQEIREISKFFNLEVQSKPSMACFSSRIPYGQEINNEKLIRIREGERFLKQVFHLKQLRVRHHEGNLARIEFLPQDLPKILDNDKLERIKAKFKELGFVYVTIDIEGFRSGSMNEVLDLSS